MDESTITAYTADDEIPGVTDVELVVCAGRVKQLTHGQYRAIRQSAIELGLPPEAASNSSVAGGGSAERWCQLCALPDRARKSSRAAFSASRSRST